jgi:hypothetical protein
MILDTTSAWRGEPCRPSLRRMSDALPSDERFSDAAGRIASLRRASGPEIVDQGIQLARQYYGAMILAALPPLLPYFGMDIWTSSRGEPVGLWPVLLLNTVWTVCASLADAAAARVAMDALEGRSPDPARALRTSLRRAWPVVLSGLYRALFGFLGLIILLVPGLYVLSVYALVPVLPVLEPGLGGWRALRRSAALTTGARRLTFGAYVAPYAFILGANMILSLLMVRVMGRQPGQLFGGLVGTGVAMAMTPFIASIQVRLYVELRMRKEAIDIEWALASTPASVAT